MPDVGYPPAVLMGTLVRGTGPKTPALCTRNHQLSKGRTRPRKSTGPTSYHSSKISSGTGVSTSYPSSLTTAMFSVSIAPCPGKDHLGFQRKDHPLCQIGELPQFQPDTVGHEGRLEARGTQAGVLATLSGWQARAFGNRC
jgi:hypothetical protein